MTIQTVGSYNSVLPMTPVTPSTLPSGSPPSVGDPGLGSDTFTQIGSLLGKAAGGGVASWKFSGKMADAIKNSFGNGFSGFMGGMKNVAVTGIKAGGISALVSGGVSAITNGIGVVTGSIQGSDALGNIAADTALGAVTGIGAVGASGLATLALGKLITGTPLTIAAVGIGAASAVLIGKLFQSSGAYESIQSSVKGALSK